MIKFVVYQVNLILSLNLNTLLLFCPTIKNPISLYQLFLSYIEFSYLCEV